MLTEAAEILTAKILAERDRRIVAAHAEGMGIAFGPITFEGPDVWRMGVFDQPRMTAQQEARRADRVEDVPAGWEWYPVPA